MKAKYIVLGLLMGVTLSANGRTFEAGERLFFNATPSNADWWKNGTYEHTTRLWGRLVEGSNEYWLEAKWYDDTNCYLEIPTDAKATRNWTHLVLYRCDYNNRNNVFNQTGQIALDSTYATKKNYIQNFYYDYKGDTKNGANWWNLSSSPSGNPTNAAKVDNVTKEIIEVCKSSVGDPLSLQPKLTGTPPTYDYDHSPANTWFKWNGTKWVALDGQQTGFHADDNAWGYEGGSSLKETIGVANSHTYYFLWSEKFSKRRFVEVAVTQDCAPTCEITDFGVVTSNVNAHDSTYVLDGIVAFKDANGKTLRISVTDAKGEHHVDYVNPSTPHIFSLPGLFANGATGLYATATFIETPYTRKSNLYDAPNAIEKINTKVINKTHGETAKLTPDYPGTDGYKWNDGNTTNHEREIPAYDFDTTIIYTYYEYEKAPEVPGNLIRNGNFSTAGFDYGSIKRQKTVEGCNISDYNFWGKDVTSSSDFYTTYGNIAGGMAIVEDANRFWKRYSKKIAPKDGDHFALFDADDSGEKAAWKVSTSSAQPDLKLAKGTNYMFSFWVANINNYGEMNNAAILQFEISYSTDGGVSWSSPEKLGNPIDLNDYTDNLWHQNSHVYVAKADADKVRISVKDLNTTGNPGGNDFALDDIKFQAISVVSQAIKHCQRFVVKIYEEPCTFSGIKIDTIRPKCSEANNNRYSLKVTLNYDKPQGTLTLTDNVYGVLTPTTTTINATNAVITIDNLPADAQPHTLTAKFTKLDAHNVDKGCEISGSYVAPGTPAFLVATPTVPEAQCDTTTFSLNVVTTLAYQNGTQLLYYWDNVLHSEATQTVTYGPSSVINTTLTGLVYDGQPHTLDVRTNNSTHDCDTSITIPAVPYMPFVHIDTVELQPYACGNTTYSVTIRASFTNSQNHDLIFKDWKTGNEEHVTVTKNDDKAEYSFTYAWEATPAFHEYNVYFSGANTCDHKKSYTSPAEPKFENVVHTIPTTVACDATTFDFTVTFDYCNQDGIFNIDLDGTAPTSISPAVTVNTTALQTVTATFTNIPADGSLGKTLNVGFSGGTHNCPAYSQTVDIPFSPVIDEVAILNAVPAKVTCSTESYEVKVKATTHYEATGKKIVFTYNDNGTKHDTAVVSGKVAEATLVLHNITEPGAPAATQTIYAAFEDHDTCLKGSNSQVTAPQHAAITGGFDVVVSEPDCGDTKYSISGQVEFDLADGDLIVEYDSNHRQVITSPASPASFTINDMDATGDNLTVKAWFSGSASDACKAESKQFASPVTPQISIETDYVYSPVTCSDETTTLTFKLNYTYQQGILHYSVDGLAEKTLSITEKDKSSIQTELSFAGIPADGKNNHVLHVRFDGPNSCAEDYTLSAAPFSPVIDNVTVTGVPTTVPCGTTAYNATVTITPHYDATGKKIILTYDSLGNRKTTPAIPLTSFPYTITLYNFSAGTHNIYAAYEDTPACTTDNSTGTYTAPVMTSCIRDSITRCENELPYWWPNANDGAGQYYTGTAGENKFGSGTDSLWLFVTATPQISVGTLSAFCDSETEILIPFTVTNGAPDSIDILIGSNHYAGSVAGGDISFTRTAELAAGDYSATITVGTKGTPCVSDTTVHFTIALGNSMYSKWTDVLFISNKDNLFTGYQWYENGMKMEGETSQRLYKPEGLPGAYYCRITTKEGKILTTCEQTFDQVQPSRTDSTEPAKVIRQYRVSPHVYIIQTQTGEEIETKKILTPYE